MLTRNGTICAVYVSYHPRYRRLMSTKLGMIVASVGMKSVANNRAKRTPFPRKRMRANAYPASTEIVSSPTVVIVAMKIVFANAFAQSVCGYCQASTQFSGCHEVGQSTGGLFAASP